MPDQMGCQLARRARPATADRHCCRRQRRRWGRRASASRFPERGGRPFERLSKRRVECRLAELCEIARAATGSDETVVRKENHAANAEPPRGKDVVEGLLRRQAIGANPGPDWMPTGSELRGRDL